MKDLWDSFKMQIHERLSSPLLGSFVISWLIWNHRLLFVLFADMSAEGRFAFIDGTLYPTGWTVVWKGALVPLLFSVLYIYLYPLVAKFINKTWLKRQVELKEQSDKIEKGRLLTPEESEKILEEARRIRSQARDEIRKLAQEFEAIKPAKGAQQSETRQSEGHDKETSISEEPNSGAIESLRRKIEELEGKMDRDVYFRSEAIYPGLDGGGLGLSDDAKDLLLAAAKDPRGIFSTNPIGGRRIDVGERKFVTDNERRTIARWEAALGELVKNHLVEKGGNHYVVTKRGFEIADSIDPSSFAGNKFLPETNG